MTEVTNERWYQHSMILTLKGELAAMRERAETAENERDKFRKALEQIEDLPGSHAEDALLIASAALEAKP